MPSALRVRLAVRMVEDRLCRVRLLGADGTEHAAADATGSSLDFMLTAERFDPSEPAELVIEAPGSPPSPAAITVMATHDGADGQFQALEEIVLASWVIDIPPPASWVRSTRGSGRPSSPAMGAANGGGADEVAAAGEAPPSPPASGLPPSPAASEGPAPSTGLPEAAAPDDPLEGGRYRVWFATNRTAVTERGAVRFTAEQATTVTYGRCDVRIPRTHRVGSIGSPWWKRLFRGDDRLKLARVDRQPVETHWDDIARRIRAAPDGEKHGVVLLHGYNVSFEEAAIRAAQIGFDLKVRGAMAFFSWPSRGAVEDYTRDEATIDACEHDIAAYLIDFSRRSGADRVHVIAHSMGNRALLRSLQRILAEVEHEEPRRFGHFILAAPDVDVRLFRQLADAYGRISRRTTLYVSVEDRALEVSRFIHGHGRVGFAPPITTHPGIDTVHVAGVDLTILGHGYVASARGVITDIHSLIHSDLPPERRLGLVRKSTQEGSPYWEILP